MFDVYTRVSEEDWRDGPSFGSPEEQEAVARTWAGAQTPAVEIEEVVYDGDVSGGAKVDDRELGRLIRKVESGESEGILVRYIDRWCRNVIEAALALDRIVAAGGRLVAVQSGFDSANLNSQTRLIYNMMNSVAQAERERNREYRLQGVRRAADRGVYLACKAPAGYVRNEDGTISPSPDAKAVQRAFRMRADGATIPAIRGYLAEQGIYMVPSGVRHMLKSRAYLGEAVKQSETKGKPDIVRNSHTPLVTPEQWERAQAAGGPYHPRSGRLTSMTQLAGLVYCAEGHRMKVGGGNAAGSAQYICSREGCAAHAAIQSVRLDTFVQSLLTDAIISEEPHVVAVLEGDNRYQVALAAIEDAQAEVDVYRDEVSVRMAGGAVSWAKGLETRLAALDLARRSLREIPKPKKLYTGPHPGTDREAIHAAMDRDANGLYISRVVVRAVGTGKRVPVEERVEVWLAGAEEPLAPATVRPQGDPDTLALLAASHA